jgi:site-specific DNA recombinase
MKRAVIYARVSTDRQAEERLSIASQIESCERKAETLGAAVIGLYKDEGISGTTDARPGFRSAINRCALGDVDYLICWNSSRFARDQHDAISYKRELVSCGTRLAYAQSEVDLSTHEGWLLDSVQQVLDENYSRQVSRDTRRSMMSAAAEGFWMGGRVPFGYRAEPVEGSKRRRLAPNEPEAAVVRQIFAWAADGIGALLIAVRLNGQGTTLHGRPWHKGSLLHILSSEVYVGTVIYNRMQRKTRKPRPESEWVRVQAHPGIVSAEIFSLVRHGLADRAPAAERGAPTSQHAFTGMLRCGSCGAALQISTGTGRGGKVYSYYACRADLQGQRCDFKRMRADKFDAWMLDELLTHLLNREVIQAVLDNLDEAASRWVQDRSKRRTAHVLELRVAESRRRRLYEVIEAGAKDSLGLAELGPRIRELNDQINKLERQLVAIEAEPEPSVEVLQVSAEEAEGIFRQTLMNTDDPRRLRSFLASITEKIDVKTDTVDVHYKPDCLVLSDGQPVRSKHQWLLDPSKLRTMVLRLPRGDSGMRFIEERAAA